MSRYRLEAEPAVEFDVEGAFEWYEAEEPVSGLRFSNNCVLLTGEFSKLRLHIRSYVQAFAVL